jgi:hypothetical protein
MWITLPAAVGVSSGRALVLWLFLNPTGDHRELVLTSSDPLNPMLAY